MTTRDHREVARARADPLLKHGVRMYDGAIKAVAQQQQHTMHPTVGIEASRQRKRAVIVFENDIKPKRESRPAPRAASRELPSFDLGPLQAEPPICVQGPSL
jgi:hypothetical protein